MSSTNSAKVHGRSTPEFQLLLTCVRGSFDPFESLRPRDLDWERFLVLADRHNVVPLVHQALAAHPDLPGKAREQLRAMFAHSTRRSLFLTAELLRLLDVFAGAGVPVLPYKGPVLAQELYGDIALRSFTDLDLMVRVADVPRALELMDSAGYSPDPPVPPGRRSSYIRLAAEQMFRRRAGAALVELQWKIAPRYFSVHLPEDWLWQRTVALRLESRELSSFSPEALLLVLAVHGAKHEWERLGWIADVAQLIARFPDLDWTSTFYAAREFRIERIVFWALALANCLLDAPLPPDVVQRISADRKVPELCQAAKRRLLADASGVPDLKGHWCILRARERWRDRLLYTARLALTPNPRDWAMLPLPAPLSPLYLLLRPLRLAARAAQAGWQRMTQGTQPSESRDAPEGVRK